jgi:hypothetical protein
MCHPQSPKEALSPLRPRESMLSVCVFIALGPSGSFNKCALSIMNIRESSDNGEEWWIKSIPTVGIMSLWGLSLGMETNWNYVSTKISLYSVTRASVMSEIHMTFLQQQGPCYTKAQTQQLGVAKSFFSQWEMSTLCCGPATYWFTSWFHHNTCQSLQDASWHQVPMSKVNDRPGKLG